MCGFGGNGSGRIVPLRGFLGHPRARNQLDAIKQFDTCSLSNAIEEFGLRLRNEGFTKPGLKCIFPELGPMLGYAVTSRIKTSDPPLTGASYYDRNDWWELMLKGPAPHVAVMHEIDPNPGIGASIGEVHGSILQALQCVGVVTDGAVRDLTAVRAMRFPMFARYVSVSHAYVHMVDFGRPVEINGLQI